MHDAVKQQADEDAQPDVKQDFENNKDHQADVKGGAFDQDRGHRDCRRKDHDDDGVHQDRRPQHLVGEGSACTQFLDDGQR